MHKEEEVKGLDETWELVQAVLAILLPVLCRLLELRLRLLSCTGREPEEDGRVRYAYVVKS